MSFPRGTVFHPQTMVAATSVGGVAYPGQPQPQAQQMQVVQPVATPSTAAPGPGVPLATATQVVGAPGPGGSSQNTFIYQEFKCNQCEFRALRLSDVELHKRSVHNGQRVVREELCESKACGNSGVPHIKSDCKKNRPFTCDNCGNAFGQKSHLDTHMKTVHGTGDKPFR